MAAETEIVIRDCNSLDDYRQCVALQKAVWGFADEDLLAVRQFVVARKVEGQVVGAFDPAGRMVGFAVAFPALRGPLVYLHSNMAAVLAEFRGRGIGRRLKLEQRRNALDRGIRLIEWTFDPLELGNAYFNLNRLGAIARRYVVNQYGISSSPLHRGLPTDRLIAEWWLDSPRVIARANDEVLPPCDVRQRIAVPLAIAQNHEKRAEVQLKLRKEFQEAFAQGLAAVGFEKSEEDGIYLIGVCGE